MISSELYCNRPARSGLLGSPAMKTTRLTGTLGQRIRQAYGFPQVSRATFHRRLLKLLPDLNYPTLLNWDSDKQTPQLAGLRAIAQATGYSLEQFLVASAGEHATPPEPTIDVEAEKLVQQLVQSGALAPVSDDDLAFMRLYAAHSTGVTEEKLVRALLGYRAATANTPEALEAFNRYVRAHFAPATKSAARRG